MTKKELIAEIEKLERRGMRSFHALRNISGDLNQYLIRQTEGFNIYSMLFSYTLEKGFAPRQRVTSTGRKYQKSLNAMKKDELQEYFELLTYATSGTTTSTATKAKQWLKEEKKRLDDVGEGGGAGGGDWVGLPLDWERWAKYYYLTSQWVNDHMFLDLKNFTEEVKKEIKLQEAVHPRQPKDEYASVNLTQDYVQWFVEQAMR